MEANAPASQTPQNPELIQATSVKSTENSSSSSSKRENSSLVAPFESTSSSPSQSVKRPHSPVPDPETSSTSSSSETLQKIQKTVDTRSEIPSTSSETLPGSSAGSPSPSGSNGIKPAVSHFPKVNLGKNVDVELAKKVCISALAGEIIGTCLKEANVKFSEDCLEKVDEDDDDEDGLLDDSFADSDDEDAVAAVLGGSNEDECSYSKGYVKRQALYSCLTCQKASGEVAGVCLACTYACHEGHDLVELYTKRHFRCDCGNSKFSGLACKLTPEKDTVNEQNQYNRNFRNEYCVCHRPYPDPELPADFCGTQVQCVLCEDWLHLMHALKNTNEKDIEEKLQTPRSLICQECLQKHTFFGFYLAAEKALDYQFEPSEPQYQVDGCALKYAKKMFPEACPIEEAAFTPTEWYESLCRCDQCKELYEVEQVEFLMDRDDSAEVYERQGREKVKEEQRRRDTLDPTQLLMGEMDRFGQIEFATRLAQMRTELREGVNSMVRELNDKGQYEIQPSDIRLLFERLREEHDRRRQNAPL